MTLLLDHPRISINQFAEFSKASNSQKLRIVQQQKKVNKLLIPWYQGAKGSIKKYLRNVNDIGPIEAQIEILKNKKPDNKRQNTDKNVSIEALERLIKMNLYKILGHIEYKILKPEIKSIQINGVVIMISPEIIIEAEIDGNIVYGAVKIHISKTKPFDLAQCNYVAVLLYDYLSETIESDASVLPQFCLCIDVFGDRIVSAKEDHKKESKEINTLCNEIAELWMKIE